MPRWRALAATAGLLGLQACASTQHPGPGGPPPRRHGYVGCRRHTCVGGDPRRRQYLDQARMRYYWFDPDRKRYYWEDGSPYP